MSFNPFTFLPEGNPDDRKQEQFCSPFFLMQPVLKGFRQVMVFLSKVVGYAALHHDILLMPLDDLMDFPQNRLLDLARILTIASPLPKDILRVDVGLGLSIPEAEGDEEFTDEEAAEMLGLDEADLDTMSLDEITQKIIDVNQQDEENDVEFDDPEGDFLELTVDQIGKACSVLAVQIRYLSGDGKGEKLDYEKTLTAMGFKLGDNGGDFVAALEAAGFELAMKDDSTPESLHSLVLHNPAGMPLADFLTLLKTL